MAQKRPDRSIFSRTSLITTAAIVGVLAAGSVAIAANIGILSAADSSPIGDLAATDDLIQTTTSAAPTETVVATTTQPPVAPHTPAATPAEYTVDEAGSVVVIASDGRLALLGASPNDGWSGAARQDQPTSLTVTFTDGSRTIVFTAALAPDGSIVADVSEPIVVAGAPAAALPTPVTASASPGDDDHEHDGHDDDRHDDDHEYEGGDDDD
jgi:hypothetical protein